MTTGPLATLTVLLLLFGVLGVAWVAVGADGRRRWKWRIREIGVGKTISRVLLLSGALVAASRRRLEGLTYAEYVATLVAGTTCMGAGVMIAVRLARRRYPHVYDDVMVGREATDPVAGQGMKRLLWKGILWSLVPAIAVSGVVYLIFRLG